MKLTRGGEYGILGVLYLAQREYGKISVLSEIARAQEVPPLFLAKVLQILTKAGVVKSRRGVKGGFLLARSAGEITMKEVIEAIEGPIALNRDKISPMHTIWAEAQEKMAGVLSRANFADLAHAERELQMSRAKPHGSSQNIEDDRRSPILPHIDFL
jgi:Rrf2 family transcriptional regulator, iron-sulfur cluster assembly transcription factor